jgi:Fibronectin type III domain.
MDGKTIISMTFYLEETDTYDFGNASWNVYMKEVEGTTVTAFIDPSTATQVYAGKMAPANGKMTISFAQPYVYNGGHLLIGFDQTVKGSDKSTSWYGIGSNGSSVTGYNSSSFSSITPEQQNFLPKIRFAFSDICNTPPSSLAASNINATSAVLSWTAGADETTWNVVVSDTELADPSTGTIDTVNGTPSYTATGLTPDTRYYVYVRSDCGSEVVSEWATLSFRTNCNYVTIPFAENFDSWTGSNISNNLPDCWNYINTGTTNSNYPHIFVNKGQAHSGNNSLCFATNSSAGCSDQYAICLQCKL